MARYAWGCLYLSPGQPTWYCFPWVLLLAILPCRAMRRWATGSVITQKVLEETPKWGMPKSEEAARELPTPFSAEWKTYKGLLISFGKVFHFERQGLHQSMCKVGELLIMWLGMPIVKQLVWGTFIWLRKTGQLCFKWSPCFIFHYSACHTQQLRIPLQISEAW